MLSATVCLPGIERAKGQGTAILLQGESSSDHGGFRCGIIMKTEVTEGFCYCFELNEIQLCCLTSEKSGKLHINTYHFSGHYNIVA